jgi:hypothetical protein
MEEIYIQGSEDGEIQGPFPYDDVQCWYVNQEVDAECLCSLGAQGEWQTVQSVFASTTLDPTTTDERVHLLSAETGEALGPYHWYDEVMVWYQDGQVGGEQLICHENDYDELGWITIDQKMRGAETTATATAWTDDETTTTAWTDQKMQGAETTATATATATAWTDDETTTTAWTDVQEEEEEEEVAVFVDDTSSFIEKVFLLSAETGEALGPYVLDDVLAWYSDGQVSHEQLICMEIDHDELGWITIETKMYSTHDPPASHTPQTSQFDDDYVHDLLAQIEAAEQRADAAEERTNAAEERAVAAELRATTAELRATTAEAKLQTGASSGSIARLNHDRGPRGPRGPRGSVARARPRGGARPRGRGGVRPRGPRGARPPPLPQKSSGKKKGGGGGGGRGGLLAAIQAGKSLKKGKKKKGGGGGKKSGGGGGGGQGGLMAAIAGGGFKLKSAKDRKIKEKPKPKQSGGGGGGGGMGGMMAEMKRKAELRRKRAAEKESNK